MKVSKGRYKIKDEYGGDLPSDKAKTQENDRAYTKDEGKSLRTQE